MMIPWPQQKNGISSQRVTVFNLLHFSDLRHARANLLEVVANPNNEISTLTTSVESYFSLLAGFVNSFDDTRPPEDSKLRYMVNFKWTESLRGYNPT